MVATWSLIQLNLLKNNSTVAGKETKCSIKVRFSPYFIPIIINQPFFVSTSTLSFFKKNQSYILIKTK